MKAWARRSARDGKRARTESRRKESCGKARPRSIPPSGLLMGGAISFSTVRSGSRRKPPRRFHRFEPDVGHRLLAARREVAPVGVVFGRRREAERGLRQG